MYRARSAGKLLSLFVILFSVETFAGLVHEYNFDGDATDSVGTADGIVGSNVIFTSNNVPAILGQAAVFGIAGGTGNEIIAPGLTDFGTGDFSIAFWVRRDNADEGTTDGVFDTLAGDNSNGWQLHIRGSDLVRIRLDDVDDNSGTFDTSAVVTDNCWHHFVVTVDRDQLDGLKWYIDGTLDVTHDPTGVSGAINASQDLHIGAQNDTSGLDGALGQAQFYDHALDPNEIATLYLLAVEDDDNDGVNNCNDACPGFDDNMDNDNDGVPDGCDTCPTFSNVDITDNVNYSLTCIPSNLRDIRDSGTELQLITGQVSPGIILPIDFEFYNFPVIQISVTASGHILLNGTANSADSLTKPIPTADSTNGFIVGFWYNFSVANIRYRRLGTAPNREFVVGFYDSTYWPGFDGSAATFEIIFHELTNDIELQYGEVDPPYQDTNTSVGIENADGTIGLQVAFGAPDLSHRGFLLNSLACPYELPGDLNRDCINNLLDFALYTQTWLTDCQAIPLNPQCQ